MKKNLFFYVLMGSWGWVVQGSTIVSQIPNLNVSVVDNFEQQNEIYNRIGVTDEEYLLMELLLHCMNLRTPIEKKETNIDGNKVYYSDELPDHIAYKIESTESTCKDINDTFIELITGKCFKQKI